MFLIHEKRRPLGRRFSFLHKIMLMTCHFAVIGVLVGVITKVL